MGNHDLTRARVYDPVLRVIHAWNGVAVCALLALGLSAPEYGAGSQTDWSWRWHLWSGYTLVIGLYARIVWGLIGPRHARWDDFWHPHVWRECWRTRRFFSEPDTFGHHPPASHFYLALYAALLVMVISGLVLAAVDRNTGPLYPWFGHDVELKNIARWPHQVGQYLIGAFVAIHLLALVLHRTWHGVPVAQAMITGNQYLKSKP